MKPWIASKTLWFNFLSAMLLIIPLVTGYLTNTTLVSAHAAAELIALLLLINTVVNAILRRFFTTVPIG